MRAYAVSLKLWFEFLQLAGTSWDEAGVEDVARFVAWLRAPAGNVIVLADGTGARGPATVNRYLAGVFGFYDHHARTGLRVAAELVSWRRLSRGSYKPFLQHVTKGRAIPVRPVKLQVPRRAPRTLEPGQIVAILAACEHLRDRFLLSTLLGWYQAGEDVQARLPVLSTYLGHRDPRSTYWYLSAAPELLALAAGQLERSQQAACR